MNTGTERKTYQKKQRDGQWNKTQKQSKRTNKHTDKQNEQTGPKEETDIKRQTQRETETDITEHYVQRNVFVISHNVCADFVRTG